MKKLDHNFKLIGAFILLGVLFNLNLRAQNPIVITATGAGSFTVPCGITSITVEVWGAGGGGGGDNSNNVLVANGGGGGGGGYCTTVMAVTPGSSIAYNIGVGGTAGAAASGGAGGNGGATNFGAVTGNGGNGGQGSGGTSLPGTGGGGSGGTVTIGNTGITGLALGGAGGAANGPGGGAGGAASGGGAGNAGNQPGGGGSGGYRNTATNRPGGAGGNGMIRITLGGTVCGDNPCSALPLPVAPACSSYTAESNSGATSSPGVPAPGCATYSGGDIWFTVTVPASGNLFIDTQTGVILDGGMAVYSGTCASLSLVACDDDNSPNGAMPAITLTGQTPGATLYIRFWENGNDNNGSFGICVTTSSLNIPQNCQGAYPVCNDATFPGNSSGSGNPELNASNEGCLATGEHQTTWFGFSPSLPGTIQFTITPTAGSIDYDFAVWGPLYPGSGCPITSSPVRCSYAAQTGATGLQTGAGDFSEGASPGTTPRFVESLVITAAEVGMVYYLVVDNYTADNTPFTLDWGLSPNNMLDCTPPLPVELLNFSGETNGPVNLIRWITASEVNSDYFILEKSEDGINYTELTRLQAAGTSNVEKEYNTVDPSPYVETYYQLKQVDKNGMFKYYGPFILKNTAAYGLKLNNVYPNPADESFFVELYSQNHLSAQLNIQVFDAYGRLIYQRPVSDEGKITYEINSASWGPGLYTVKISADNYSFNEVRKIIIK